MRKVGLRRWKHSLPKEVEQVDTEEDTEVKEDMIVVFREVV